jgi:hypothetical protein
MKLSFVVPVAASIVAVASIAFADPPGAPVVGHVTVAVTQQNAPAFNSLQTQSQSLGARLASYNARASVPTSSPATYRALVAEKQALAKEVTQYNAAATNLARQSPPSRISMPARR